MKSEARSAISKEFTRPENLLLGFVGRAVEQKFRLLAESFRGKSVMELPDVDFPELNDIPLDRLQLLKLPPQDPNANDTNTLVRSGCGSIE